MDDEKVVHEIARNGNIFFLINAFIGAYNRRTDVIAREAETQEKVRQLTQRLKVQNDALDAATKHGKES